MVVKMKTECIRSVPLFFLVLFLYNIFPVAYTQESSDQISVLLFGTIVKLENNVSKADENIRRYENEILKCEKTIATSEKIKSHAQEKGNSEVGKVANEALLKANSAKDKNNRLLNIAELRKKQSETILASVKNSSSLNSTKSSTINAVTLNYSGEINIQKNNGEKFKVDENQSPLLEAGDVITTAENSKIEMQFLEGRGNVIVGENSKLKMEKLNDSTDVMDVIEGKVKLGVLKVDEYEKDLKEKYEAYKNDSLSADEYLNNLYGHIRAGIKHYTRKFEVRTPTAVCANRGTEFIVYYNENNSSEVIVLEGTVEMKSTNGLNTILINAGQKGVANEKGILSGPIQIDVTKLEKWWEDEQ
jgi:FecR protein